METPFDIVRGQMETIMSGVSPRNHPADTQEFERYSIVQRLETATQDEMYEILGELSDEHKRRIYSALTDMLYD